MVSIFAPRMVAAVSEAGGLGALGCHGLSTEQIRSAAGLINEILPAAQIVLRIVSEAERILSRSLPGLVR